MKRWAWILVVIALGLALGYFQNEPVAPAPTAAIADTKPSAIKNTPSVSAQLMKLPLRFEVNDGQAPDPIQFVSRGPGYGLYLEPTQATFGLNTPVKPDKEEKQNPIHNVAFEKTPSKYKSSVIRMRPVGGNPNALMSGEGKLITKSNYFIGNDPEKWHTNITNYGRVRYSEVYPGIDLLYYGNPQRLEYDFVVQPGADPGRIVLEFDGAKDISIDDQGNLILQLEDGQIVQQAPVVYQEIFTTPSPSSIRRGAINTPPLTKGEAGRGRGGTKKNPHRRQVRPARQ